jgi:hypothetical protein
MSETTENEFAQNAFRQFLDIWVTPEVVRRQEVGTLAKPLALDAFQIVWFPDDRPRQIRINRGEVRARLRVNVKEGVQKLAGEELLLSEVESFDGVELTEQDDPDCGHATFIRFGQQWYGQFDAIYNKGLAKRHLDVGLEFQNAAAYALDQRLMYAFVDNLFSAAELYAKAKLLLLAGFGFRKKATHEGIHAHYNKQSHLGNVDSTHSSVLNRLSGLRPAARYLKGDLTLIEDDYQVMLKLVGEMHDQAQRVLTEQ